MIAECFASKLSFGRKMLSNLAVAFVVALPLVSGLVSASHLRAQSAAPASAPDIAATWQGTLHGGQALRTVSKVTKADQRLQRQISTAIGPGRPTHSV